MTILMNMFAMGHSLHSVARQEVPVHSAFPLCPLACVYTQIKVHLLPTLHQSYPQS